MSDRAFEFVHQWAAEHVAPTVFQEDDDCSEAHTLAEELLNDAKNAGISKRQIEDAVGDAVEFLASELNDSTLSHIDSQ